MKIEPLKIIWMDGDFVEWENAKIHVLTHGLHYGLAIFEGIKLHKTKNGPAFFRMKDHYNRLIEGCKCYRFKPNYSADELCNITKELIKKINVEHCYVRPIVYTGYGEISPDMRQAEVKVAICPVSLGKYFGEKTSTGITCMVSSWRRMNPDYLSPQVKACANYLNSALAKMEAQDAGFDECIFLNRECHVTEASGANLFIVKDGKILTPPEHDGILSGITRDSVIKIAKNNGLDVCEKTLLRDQLYKADEMFLCGTASGITPVIIVDSRVIGDGSVGPVTLQLKKKYDEILTGEAEDSEKWLEYI